jgi:hypothetical protein
VPLPPPRLLRRTLSTTAVLWAGFHLALALLGTPYPVPAAAVPLVMASAAAALLELRSSRELLFHANLGVRPASSAFIAVVAAAVLEVLFQLAVSIAGVR